jgi:tRNA(Ile)-lysidine synthase
MMTSFERNLSLAWPPPLWKDVTVVVAVSGGADSVALLRGLHAVRETGAGQLVAAHFHRGLRGQAADEDARFVTQLCRQLGLECVVQQAVAAAGQSALASEQDARQARYEFLRAATRRLGGRYVVTAHTADDQAETILHRIVRGTGIGGLAGIPAVRPLLPGVSLVRPLLGLRRREVVEYLQGLGQPFRTDLSNRDPRFTRNRIRHELVPELIASYNPEVVSALTRLGGLAGEVQEVIDQAVDQLQQRCVTQCSPDAVTIDCAGLRTSHAYLVRELLMDLWRRQNWPLQAMGRDRWTELAGMVIRQQPEPTKQVFPGHVTAQRQGDMLSLLAGE